MVGRKPKQKQSLRARLLEDWQKQADAAKQANLQRYQQITEGRTNLMNRLLKEMEGYGTQREADLRQEARQQGAAAQQDLVSRGLATSTITPTVQAGVQRDLMGNIGRLRADIQAKRMGIISGQEGERLGAIERRTDVGPSEADMLKLLEGMGSAKSPRARMLRSPGFGGRGMGMTWMGMGDTVRRRRMPAAKKPAVQQSGGLTFGALLKRFGR
jgi:hypothetical protein